ncbi:GAF domain-containing sensor histidine kinase [Glaciihabitans sp. INWT7]|uniref:GAF domain-containing sensor histidine kinase n=1 Tax=Glaciihabitans sp. INWT7 TaxID=2596912 RepID=UPI001626B10F|nr:GAF domain-containing sensor histidine kinase [Glaciihabitans sp. INWT7]
MVLETVARHVSSAIPANFLEILQFTSGAHPEVVAAWGEADDTLIDLNRWALADDELAQVIVETAAPTRVESVVFDASSQVTRHRFAIASSVGVPIAVDDAVWGAILVHSTSGQALPAGTESRLVAFTDLISSVISNSRARAAFEELAAEQTALFRVAELVARGTPPDHIFATIAEELGRLIDVEGAKMARFEPDDMATFVASWGVLGGNIPVGARLSTRGTSVTCQVRETGSPARVDDYTRVDGEIAEVQRGAGMSSAVGAPITVDGVLWGALIVGSGRPQPLPADTGERMVRFADLIAIALANLQSRLELIESRARIVKTADEVRHRFERDLHDGIQQRLITAAVNLSSVGTSLPSGLAQRDDIVGVTEQLNDVLEQLRELSRGLHPAILSDGGLPPALRSLARHTGTPTEVDLGFVPRLPSAIEVAAYYVVSEALANTSKHGGDAKVRVGADYRDGILIVDVTDDGIGGADPSRGSGLTGLRDRVDALGGSLTVHSIDGSGTTISARFPCVVT